jgi:hypothetical protein
MNQEINRLLMELERTMRDVNRAVLNPEIPELTVDELRPVLHQVAESRARYLRALLELGKHSADGAVPAGRLEELTRLRREYEELVSGAKALETAIQRGYLDVQSSKR